MPILRNPSTSRQDALGNALRRCAEYAVLAIVFAIVASAARAEAPRVLPVGKRPADARLGELTTLNGYFPFKPPASQEEWERRAERVRRQVLVATGLWPMPTRTPSNPVIHGKVERDDYTVEKVYLESFPGHFVTGNLYRPKDAEGLLPGVLCPHGHWANGRFYDEGPQKIRQAIVKGQERFEAGGRSPLQSRCVQLARMGCVVFHYDMVGYGDSGQFDHRPGIRQHMNTPENWGYFSPQAELRMQNMMGLQTYNSIRALDFLCELPDVDAERIAVTGASGGGTQTFILCAIDSRPKVAFPAVMVSTAMQGGCTCENACYLRVGTGNIELAALFAPKPLGMTAANDWTREIASKGLPELKQLYEMLGMPARVTATPLLHFGHNYNYVSRAVMYPWLNRHLDLGFAEPIVEEDYEPLSIGEMSVWNDDHPKPEGGDDYERSLVRWINEDSERQLEELLPSDEATLVRWREIVGGALDVMIGRDLPGEGAIELELLDKQDQGERFQFLGLLRDGRHGEEFPIVFLHPKEWNKQVVIWVHPEGKSGLFDSAGQPLGPVAQLLAGGASVVGIDLLGQGEFLAAGDDPSRARVVGDARGDYAGYTFGYNAPLFSKRVHDILSVISFIRHDERKADVVSLVGARGAGHWVAAASAQAGDAVDRTAVVTDGFRFARLRGIDSPAFLPGAVKYGDLPGMLSLLAPRALWLAGEGTEPPRPIRAAYDAAGESQKLTLHDGKTEDAAAAAVEWLLR